MDSDFIVIHNCIGRNVMSRPRRWFVDLVCKHTGHLLWRCLGSVYTPPGGSLDVYGTYCRRCFRGGYVQSDYVRKS
jgi:hypothetical protein